jgi:hypothetical protein
MALLSAQSLGSIVKIKENGVAQDFYVAKHGYVSGRTLLVRRYIYDTRQWHTSNVNAYASSAIDSWLTGTYLAMLPTDIQAQIAAVSIPYTPGNGNTAVSSISRKVFLLSLTELGGSHTYANVEGTALDSTVVNLLKIATNSAGTAQVQWTRSPNTNNTYYAWYLNTYGSINVNYCTSTYGARPAFTLPSSLSVETDGTIAVNSAPVINYSGSTALGTQNAGFTVTYSASDADGNAVTVTEKLDGTTKRSHSPTLGANQQFQAVLPANFQKVLNGNHTLRIEATDGTAAATPVEITFTKAVYSCSITLATPLVANDMPTAIRLMISGSIPSDAVWTAEVCNNGNDASPTWENIKTAVQNDNNFLFTNTTKTAVNWGVNIRVTFARGPSNVGGYIYALEGGFQ